MTINIDIPDQLLSAYPELQTGFIARPARLPFAADPLYWYDVLIISPVTGRSLWSESKFIPYGVRFMVVGGAVTDAELIAVDDTGLSGADITGRKTQLLAVGQQILNAGTTEDITITFS